MGCPPDPYEVSMSHSSDETKVLAQKAATFLHQLNQAFGVIGELLKKIADTKITSDYFSSMEKLKAGIKELNITTIEKRFNWEDLLNGRGPDDMDWSVIYNHINASNEKVKKLEITLCKTRDILLKIYRNNKPHLSEELYKKLETEIALHLDHRKDDRNVMLSILKKTIASDEEYLATLEKKSRDYKHFDNKIKESIKEFERISKLTDDDLLTSRDVF